MRLVLYMKTPPVVLLGWRRKLQIKRNRYMQETKLCDIMTISFSTVTIININVYPKDLVQLIGGCI